MSPAADQESATSTHSVSTENSDGLYDKLCQFLFSEASTEAGEQFLRLVIRMLEHRDNAKDDLLQELHADTLTSGAEQIPPTGWHERFATFLHVLLTGRPCLRKPATINTTEKFGNADMLRMNSTLVDRIFCSGSSFASKTGLSHVFLDIFVSGGPFDPQLLKNHFVTPMDSEHFHLFYRLLSRWLSRASPEEASTNALVDVLIAHALWLESQDAMLLHTLFREAQQIPQDVFHKSALFSRDITRNDILLGLRNQQQPLKDLTPLWAYRAQSLGVASGSTLPRDDTRKLLEEDFELLVEKCDSQNAPARHRFAVPIGILQNVDPVFLSEFLAIDQRICKKISRCAIPESFSMTETLLRISGTVGNTDAFGNIVKANVDEIAKLNIQKRASALRRLFVACDTASRSSRGKESIVLPLTSDLPLSLKDMATSGPYDSRIATCEIIAHLYQQGQLLAQVLRKEISLSVQDDLKVSQRELFCALAASASPGDELLVKAVKTYIKSCMTKIAQRPDGVILFQYLIRCQDSDYRLVADFIDRRTFLKMHKSVKSVRVTLSVIECIFGENAEKMTEKEMSSFGDFVQLSVGHSSLAVRNQTATVLRKISKLRNGRLMEKIWNMNLQMRLNIPLSHLAVDDKSAPREGLWRTPVAEASEKSKESAILSSEVIQGETNDYLALSGVRASQSAQETFGRLFAESCNPENTIPPYLVTALAEALCAWHSLSPTKFAKQKMLDTMGKCLCTLPSKALLDVVQMLHTVFVCGAAASLAAQFKASSRVICARLACLLTISQQDAFTEEISTSITQCANEISTSVSPCIVAECAILDDESLRSAYLKLEHRNYLTDKFVYAKRFVDETQLSESARQHTLACCERMGVTDAFYSKKLQEMIYNKTHLESNVFAKLDDALRLVEHMVAATNGRPFSTNLEKVVRAVLPILHTPSVCLPSIVGKIERILLAVLHGCCIDHSNFAAEMFTRLIVHCTAKWMTPNFEESHMLSEKAVHSALQKLDWHLSKDSHLALLASVVPYFFTSTDEANFDRHLATIGLADEQESTSAVQCSDKKPQDATMTWLQKARPTRRYSFSHATQEQILRVVREGFSTDNLSLSLPLFDALVHIAMTEPVFSCEVADVLCQQSHRMGSNVFIRRLLALLFTSNTLLIRGALQCINDASFSLSPALRTFCHIGVSLCCHLKEKEIAQLAQEITASRGFALCDTPIDELLSLLLKVDGKAFMRLHPALAEMHTKNPTFIHQSAQYLSQTLHELRDRGTASRIVAILNASAWQSTDAFPIIRGLVGILDIDDSQLHSGIIACARNLLRQHDVKSIGSYHDEILKQLEGFDRSKQFRPDEALYSILQCQAAIVLEDAEKVNASVQSVQRLARHRMPMQFTKAFGCIMSEIGELPCVQTSGYVDGWVVGLTNDLFSTELSGKNIVEGAVPTLVVSLLSAVGMISISKYAISEKIQENIRSSKGSLRIRALVLAKELHGAFGYLFEPYILFLKSSILEAVFDADGEVNQVAKDVLQSMIAGLSPIGTQQILPALLLDFSKDSIRAKKDLMDLIISIALRNGPQTLTVLHMIIPVVVEHLSDTHETVAKKAAETLQRIVSLIPCEEIRNHIRRITAALQNPGCDTEEALDALLSARFRHSLDIASLSLILPIILRGIREKNVQIKLKSAQILSSITSILSDFSTLVEMSAEVINLLVSTINEPLEAYQTSVALAVASLLEHHEEYEQVEYVQKFSKILTTIDVEPLQRAGSAKLISELYRILPRQNIDKFLKDISTQFMHLPVNARIGYLQLFTELSKRFLIQDDANVTIVIGLLLQSLPEEVQELQTNVASVARSLIRTNPVECANEMLQGLYTNFMAGDFKVRKRSFLLVVDMFHQAGGVQRDLVVPDEDSDGEGAGDPTPQSAEASVDDPSSDPSANNPVESYATLTETIDTAMVHKVLACAYVMRLERDKEIKLQAITVWKSFIRNSHSFVKEISDHICTFVGALYGSKELEDVAVATQATTIILARLPHASLERLFTTQMAALEVAQRPSFLCFTHLLPYLSDEYVDEVYESIESIIISALQKPDDADGTLVSFVEKLMTAHTKQNILERLVEKELTVIEQDESHIDGFCTLLRVRPKAVMYILYQKLEDHPSGLAIVHVRLLNLVLEETAVEDILSKFLLRTIKLLLGSPESLLEAQGEITEVFRSICLSCWSSRQEVLSVIGDGGDSVHSDASKELRLAFLCSLGQMSVMRADAEILIDILTNLVCQFSAQDVEYIHLVLSTLIAVREEIQSDDSELQPLYQYTACIDGCLRTTYQGSLLGNAGKFPAVNSVYGLHAVLPFYTSAIIEGPPRQRDDALQGLSFLLGVVDKEVVSTIWPRVAGEVLFVMLQEDFITGEFIQFFRENIPRLTQRSFETHAATIIALLFDSCLTDTNRAVREDAMCLAFICNQHCMSDQLVVLAVKSAELALSRLENAHPMVIASICRGVILFLKNAQEKVSDKHLRPLLTLVEELCTELVQPIGPLHKLKGWITANVGEVIDLSALSDTDTHPLKTVSFFEGYVTGSQQSEMNDDNLKIVVAVCRSAFSRSSSASKENPSPRTVALRVVCECIRLAQDVPTATSLWSLAVEMASVDSAPTTDDSHSSSAVFARIVQKSYSDHAKHLKVKKSLESPLHEGMLPYTGKSQAYGSMPENIRYRYDAEVEDEHTSES
ncbi:translational activator GCN1 [Perkinsela sp. CCAP 1560/4]|nr:translational activator GCN1 [Perkinsela sp. CCAP 1560/4]|eukprot:KNH01761.1 translational activator GCN1 [Perkinsela sp. CCAP 1560/4]